METSCKPHIRALSLACRADSSSWVENDKISKINGENAGVQILQKTSPLEVRRIYGPVLREYTCLPSRLMPLETDNDKRGAFTGQEFLRTIRNTQSKILCILTPPLPALPAIPSGTPDNTRGGMFPRECGWNAAFLYDMSIWKYFRDREKQKHTQPDINPRCTGKTPGN